MPGIGRIKSIYQRGTTWLVQTDAGLIQKPGRGTMQGFVNLGADVDVAVAVLLPLIC